MAWADMIANDVLLGHKGLSVIQMHALDVKASAHK